MKLSTTVQPCFSAGPQLIFDQFVALIVGQVAGVKFDLHDAPLVREAVTLMAVSFGLNEIPRGLPGEQSHLIDKDQAWTRRGNSGSGRRIETTCRSSRFAPPPRLSIAQIVPHPNKGVDALQRTNVKSAQNRAIQNYRSRLTKRGIVRFELQALETDRELIRELARKLSLGGPEAGSLRRTVQQAVSGEPPQGRWHLECIASLATRRRRCRPDASARRRAQGRSVTRYLLDTNIIRNVVKPQPSEALLAWMAAQRDEDLFIASLTVAEIRRGILEKPRGKKRDALDAWFSGPEGPQALFAGRILAFDEKAGLIWARLMAEGKTAGQPRSGGDMIIAAVAGANECTVVTDNERDFAGVQITNPMRGGAP